MNAPQGWQSVLGQLQMEMPKSSFDTWVSNAELVSYEDNTFVIGVPNAYACDWLEMHLTGTVTAMLTDVMHVPQQVKFTVWQKGSTSAYEAEPAFPETAVSASEPEGTYNQTVNSRYFFENFVVGASNRLAHAACLAVAENPARAYNPLFLYGGVGLGKTHLLHAIGNSVSQRNMKVLYVSSEEFTNDFIASVREHTPIPFRERYRQIDVLMIDDIQFLVNKEQTQVEFFHTFNTLHGQNKQIIITSDRPPKALMALEERLRSRFEWGLTVDIQPPDLETRIAILRSKAERAKKNVPPEILELIARKVQSNIRELEGALNRVLAFAELIGHELTPDLVHTALVDLLPQRSKVEPNAVMDVVATTFGISVDRLNGRDRSQSVALPRQVAMYIMRDDLNISLPQIGETLGGRDHTTVMHACSKVADLIETDDHLRRQIVSIREQLYGTAAMAA